MFSKSRAAFTLVEYNLLGMAVCVVVGVKGVIDPSSCPYIQLIFDDDSRIDFIGQAFLHPSM